MRWEDWDVLLFGANSHTPIQEFRITPFTTNDHGLLTCFVPSQPAGGIFSVSVHSWNKRPQGHIFEIKVIVDGACVVAQVLTAETSWPHVISKRNSIDSTFGSLFLTGFTDNSNMVAVNGETHPALLFPPFHKSTSSQSHWNALEDLGRIKVELYIDHAPHVVFSFQHAPLGKHPPFTTCE